MEHNKRHHGMTTLRPIPFSVSETSLWNGHRMGRRVLVKMRSMLPQLKFSAECQRGLQSIPSLRKLGLSKASKDHFLSLRISLSCSGTHTVKINQRRDAESFEQAIESIQEKIDSSSENLEPLDLVRVIFYPSRSFSLVSCSLIFPGLAFSFQGVPAMSLVSTPLTELLVSRSNNFQTGFLTMDQRRRLLPLTVSDPLAYKFPLLGVWAKAVPCVDKRFPFTHPLVWSACVRFVTHSKIAERVGSAKTFLFVYFGEKTGFFEVALQEHPVWAVATEHINLKKENTVKFLREKQSLKKPPLPAMLMSASSEDKQSTRESWPEPPRAEAIIQEQEKALKVLQRQVKDLQFKISGKRPSRKSDLRSAGTNTSFAVRKEENFRSLNNEMRTSSKSLPCSLRECLKGNQDETLLVPKIVYDSSAESSEDEDFQDIHRRYLGNV